MRPSSTRSFRDAALGALLVLGGLELALRSAGFRYAHYPVSMRYVSTLAKIGAEPSLYRKRFRVDYTLDHDLLWRPLPAPGVTNSQGFLGPEWAGAKTKPRLIALGDSCTVAGETPYPSRLPALMPGWEVWNAGVGSWSSYQGMKLLETRLLAYEPDLVTIYFGWNDHWLAWAAPDKELSALLDRQWRVLHVVERSRLLQALLRLADLARGGRSLAPAVERFRVELDDYEANLRRMVSLLGPRRALLVTAPTSLTPEHPTTKIFCEQTRNFLDPRRINEVHDAYNERVRKVARETGAGLLDLAKELKDERYFSDGIHLTPAGHAAAAKALAHAVKPKR